MLIYEVTLFVRQISCPSDPSFPPQQYSGYSLPDPISIPRCSLALVNFRTDDNGISTGFSLSYTVTVEGKLIDSA